MNKVLLKDSIRTINRTSSRFFSIVCIVALGISFFAGMNATAPDMRETARDYYEAVNASDLRIISTAGLTGDDLSVIESIQGVEGVAGEKFVDAILKVDGNAVSDIDGSQLTVRAISLDVNKAAAATAGQDDRSFINRPQLISGNWPTQPDQCVVDSSMLSTPEEFKIGAVVSVENDDTDITASLSNTQFTIVGIIRSPLYISYERGNTTIGTGKLGTFIYIPEDNFLADYYSAISVRIAGADDYAPYSKEYSQYIAPYVSYINSISAERLSLRVNALKNEYTSKVEQGEEEYAKTKSDVDVAIADGQAKVEQILDMAENGDAKLAEYKQEYNQKAAEAEEQINANKLEHSTQYAEWEAARDKYNEAKELVDKYSNAETDYKNAVTQYNVASVQVNTMLSTVSYLENLVATTRGSLEYLDQNQSANAGDIISRFETSGLVGSEVDQIISSIKSFTAVGTAEEISAYMEPQLQSLEASLAQSKQNLSNARMELASKKADLEKAEQLVEKLKEVQAALDTAEVELAEAEKKLTGAGYDIQLGELEVLSQLSDAKNQITNYETNLALAKEKAGTIEEEFKQTKENAYQQLEDAQKRLNSARNFLLGLDTAKWYVNDRDDSLYGYEEYGNMADRTAALSKIFPWFFFIVAALVCLNSMTRLVDDERTQLGTLKALGFRNKEIVLKYVLYAFVASTIGAVAGSFLGFAVFPLALTKSYGIIFDLPSIEIKYRIGYAIPGIILSVGVTVFATYLACRKNLALDASSLMRPKAPKGGKRVWLEKYPKIWSKLGFTGKVTMRNVLRNKKRFIMAVIGVMGCTSMLVAGFGLNTSINATLKNQFTNNDSIWCYDMQVVLSGSYDTTISECAAVNKVNSRPEVTSSMLEYMKVYNTTSATVNEKTETYLLVPENEYQVGNYIRLREKRSEDDITLPQDGAVITKKLAKILELKPGSIITVNIDDNRSVDVPVAAVVENYTFHYIYMTKDVYRTYFGTNPTYNYMAVNLNKDITQEQKTALASELMDEYDISAVSYTDFIQTMFENILDSIGYIVIVLIVSSAFLSVIVMYNLSVMNINERIKEIATIKVLGFNKREVSDYIFRENLILSAVGTLIGLICGIGLHRIVVKVGEVNIVTFGRSIGFMGFVYSALLSMAFSFFVNLILKRKLRNVNMVESLKSVE